MFDEFAKRAGVTFPDEDSPKILPTEKVGAGLSGGVCLHAAARSSPRAGGREGGAPAPRRRGGAASSSPRRPPPPVSCRARRWRVVVATQLARLWRPRRVVVVWARRDVEPTPSSTAQQRCGRFVLDCRSYLVGWSPGAQRDRGAHARPRRGRRQAEQAAAAAGPVDHRPARQEPRRRRDVRERRSRARAARRAPRAA